MSKQARIILSIFGLAMLLAIPSSLFANQFVGQRFKVTGQWNGKYLEATRLQQRDAKNDPTSGRIEGKIVALNAQKHGLQIGPMFVKLSRATQLEGLGKDDIKPGRTIQAIGKLESPGVLLATSLEGSSLSEKYVEMLGSVTAGARKPNGKIQMEILGVPVLLDEEIYDRGFSLARNPDDKRPDKQLTVPLFGKPLILGGEFGNASNFRGDYKLKNGAEDDQLKFEQGLELELFYRPNKNLAVFVEGKTAREAVPYAESGPEPVFRTIKRGEMWIYANNIFGSPFSAQIGRQNFREQRQWWWDADLDAVRLYFSRKNFYFETAYAQELGYTSTEFGKFDPEQEGVQRVLGQASWRWQKDHRLDLFFLKHNDISPRPRINQFVPSEREDESDARLRWLGMRMSGEAASTLEYWLEGALVQGNEVAFAYDADDDGRNFVEAVQARNVKGWAFDSGLSWQTPLPWQPTFTLSYALGSGGSANGEDRSFRQTGLQENNNKFNGVDRFRFYGELLRPELSNLRLLTAAAGWRFWRASSIEFLYHRYRQYQPADFLRGTRLKADPEGIHPDIGQEWNVVIGIEELQRLEIEIVGGLFRAGKAYGALKGETAYNAILKMDFNF